MTCLEKPTRNICDFPPLHYPEYYYYLRDLKPQLLYTLGKYTYRIIDMKGRHKYINVCKEIHDIIQEELLPSDKKTLKRSYTAKEILEHPQTVLNNITTETLQELGILSKPKVTYHNPLNRFAEELREQDRYQYHATKFKFKTILKGMRQALFCRCKCSEPDAPRLWRWSFTAKLFICILLGKKYNPDRHPEADQGHTIAVGIIRHNETSYGYNRRSLTVGMQEWFYDIEDDGDNGRHDGLPSSKFHMLLQDRYY